MKAIVIDNGALHLEERPAPEPGAGEILVRVRAAGVNRADLFQREGNYPAPPGSPADIPGLELAGEVAAWGAGVTQWRTGDRVFGVVGGGAQAEFAITRADGVARIPDSLDWPAAGGTPEAFVTAHDALVTQGALVAGERVLVHAVGSGVGLAAVQLVRAFGGIPFGTARSADKIERARAFGLEDGFVVAGDLAPLDEAVARWTGGKGIDLTLDLVGGDYVVASMRAAALRGRIILIGTMAGGKATIPIGMALYKRLRLQGTALRGRSAAEKAEATAAFARDVLPLLASGAVRVPVDATYPLAEATAAYDRVKSNATFGKVVLLP